MFKSNWKSEWLLYVRLSAVLCIEHKNMKRTPALILKDKHSGQEMRKPLRMKWIWPRGTLKSPSVTEGQAACKGRQEAASVILPYCRNSRHKQDSKLRWEREVNHGCPQQITCNLLSKFGLWVITSLLAFWWCKGDMPSRGTTLQGLNFALVLSYLVKSFLGCCAAVRRWSFRAHTIVVVGTSHPWPQILSMLLGFVRLLCMLVLGVFPFTVSLEQPSLCVHGMVRTSLENRLCVRWLRPSLSWCNSSPHTEAILAIYMMLGRVGVVHTFLTYSIFKSW